MQKKYLYQIVSSDTGTDVDRMDYILRDCKYSGMKYSFELETILQNTHISENNEISDTFYQVKIDKNILKFLFLLDDLINCWPILPIHPEIAKLIFFINR